MGVVPRLVWHAGLRDQPERFFLGVEPGVSRWLLVQRCFVLYFVLPVLLHPVDHVLLLRLPPLQDPSIIYNAEAKRRAGLRRGSAFAREPARRQKGNMQVRVITMRYQEGLQGFSEDMLQRVTFGKTVLNVSEHFFLHGNVPHLALVLQLGDTPHYENVESYRKRDPNAPNPEDEMTDVQKAAYRALRDWRNETAKIEGRPAYAIARNVQLAELVRAAPKSKAAIREVAGCGEGFVEKYGDKVLAMLAEVETALAVEDSHAEAQRREIVGANDCRAKNVVDVNITDSQECREGEVK